MRALEQVIVATRSGTPEKPVFHVVIRTSRITCERVCEAPSFEAAQEGAALLRLWLGQALSCGVGETPERFVPGEGWVPAPEVPTSAFGPPFVESAPGSPAPSRETLGMQAFGVRLAREDVADLWHVTPEHMRERYRDIGETLYAAGRASLAGEVKVAEHRAGQHLFTSFLQLARAEKAEREREALRIERDAYRGDVGRLVVERDEARALVGRLGEAWRLIVATLERRGAQLHGEACAFCHGAGSARTCPRPETSPGLDDRELLDAIAEILGVA